MIETMTQFSVFLGNKPSVLGQVCHALGAAKINIVALTMMDTGEHGVLRVIARDALKMKRTLEELNLPFTQTQVLAVTMPNRPGALADVCERLSTNRVQISYVYSTTGAPGGKTIGVFKVQNAAKAERVLQARTPGRRDMKSKLRNRQKVMAGARR